MVSGVWCVVPVVCAVRCALCAVHVHGVLCGVWCVVCGVSCTKRSVTLQGVSVSSYVISLRVTNWHMHTG